ncbi:uncharacterized protein LOC132042524 isoform X1 [Lycium ferocissimum]|uniref:uncharacterized protein LOC132042524 isoform X1 n=1 Tax=Lycium ferocissimum TaxID=112874 RepID=UPI002814DE5E|nr:uncharacterized protein LOC132042524 isoform X1 [Lycium ferocissimum]
MEVDTGNSCFIEKLPVERYTTSTRETKKSPPENNKSPPVFVNHAAIAWHENRRTWVGDVSSRSDRMPKDPIIRDKLMNGSLDLYCTEKDDLSYTPKNTRRMSSYLLHYGVQLTVGNFI